MNLLQKIVNSEIITEKVFKLQDEFVVHERPSINDIKILLSKSKDNILRGMAVRLPHDRGNPENWSIFFWDAYNLDHSGFLRKALASGINILDDIGIFISTDPERAYMYSLGSVGKMQIGDLHVAYYPAGEEFGKVLTTQFPRIFGNGAVNEEWLTTIKPSYAKGLEVDLYKNPSRAEFGKLIKEFRELRGILDQNGDLVVWNAYLATHGDIEIHFDSVGAYLYLTKDRLELNDMQYYYSDNEAGNGPRYNNRVRTMYIYAKNNMALNRIYGRDFFPVGIDRETRQEFEISPEWIDQNVEQ